MMKFEAKVGKEGWFGIGFGKKMKNSDMIIFRRRSVMDAWSTGYSAPKADKEQHLEDIKITDEGDFDRYVAYRKLQTGDKQDYQAELETDIEMMWAERRKGAYFGMHTQYNWFTANLKESPTDGDDEEVQVIQKAYVPEEKVAEQWFMHGMVMTIAWFPLAFLTIATNRWGAIFWRKRQILHSIFGFLATFFTMFSGSMAISKLGGLQTGLHEVFGTFIYAFCVIMILFGMATMNLRKLAVWNTKSVTVVSQIHRYMSWMLIIVSIPAIATGWYKYLKKYAPQE